MLTIPKHLLQLTGPADIETKEPQSMQLEPTKFIGKNGVEIKAGDLIKIEHIYKNCEFRDREKFTRMEDSHIAIHYDEGNVIRTSLEWVTFRVQWLGACMVAIRENYSSFGKCTNLRELPIQERVINFNAHFKPELFEVLQETNHVDNSQTFVTTHGSGGY